MLGGLFGLLGTVGSLGNSVNDAVGDIADSLSPGATSAFTTTGNLIGNSGVTNDLFDGLESGDLTGGIADVYSDIIGPGGVVNNLGDGYGLGVEGLLGGVLNTVDGFMGTGEGLLDGGLGGLGLGDLGGLLG